MNVSRTWARACTVYRFVTLLCHSLVLFMEEHRVFQFVLDVLWCWTSSHLKGASMNLTARVCSLLVLASVNACISAGHVVWCQCYLCHTCGWCVAQPSFMWLSSVSRYSGRVATAVRQFDPHPRGWCCGETSGHLQWKLLTPTQVRCSDTVVLTVFCVVTILLSSFCAVKIKLVSISTLWSAALLSASDTRAEISSATVQEVIPENDSEELGYWESLPSFIPEYGISWFQD